MSRRCAVRALHVGGFDLFENAVDAWLRKAAAQFVGRGEIAFQIAKKLAKN